MVNFVSRPRGLQATFDKIHLVLARPMRIWPDVAKSFPNVSAKILDFVRSREKAGK